MPGLIVIVGGHVTVFCNLEAGMARVAGLLRLCSLTADTIPVTSIRTVRASSGQRLAVWRAFLGTGCSRSEILLESCGRGGLFVRLKNFGRAASPVSRPRFLAVRYDGVR